MKNSIEYIKLLERSGLDRKQAEAHLNVMEKAMYDNVSTKEDIHRLETDIQRLETGIHNLRSEFKSELKQAISGLRTEFKEEVGDLQSELREFKAETRMRFENLEYKMTTKLGGLIIASMSALAAFIKLFPN